MTADIIKLDDHRRKPPGSPPVTTLQWDALVELALEVARRRRVERESESTTTARG